MQAVLVVCFLNGYRTLDDLLTEAGKNENFDLKSIIDPVADMTAMIHFSVFSTAAFTENIFSLKQKKTALPTSGLLTLKKCISGYPAFLLQSMIWEPCSGGPPGREIHGSFFCKVI